MKRFRLAIFILLLIPGLLEAVEINLLESDWQSALTVAQEEQKCLYIAFLGDGWSVSSKRFRRHILESNAFSEFAANQLLYCPVLARRTPKLGKKETARLQALVIHLDIKSYPTIVLLAPDGKEILRHGYRDDSPEEYTTLLQTVIPGGLAENPTTD